MNNITVLLFALGVASAARDESLKVVDKLRDLQPAYKKQNIFVVEEVASSKRNVSDTITTFQTNITNYKEQYLNSAIMQEADILKRIDSQYTRVSEEECLKKLRTKVELDVLLAGIKFSSCILDIDEKLNEQISQVYNLLDNSSGSPKNFTIYQAFRGLNIFEKPQDIVEKLQEKLLELNKLPTELPNELEGYVNVFQKQLMPINTSYESCLKDNDDLITEAFSIISKQLTYYCGGK